MTLQAHRELARIELGKISLTERAYECIKREIVKCSIRPGSVITEVELAARYDVGRAAVRAALARLYQEGLVQPVARRGYEVAPITIKRVRDLFALRLLLEPPAANLAAGRADQHQLQELDELCRAGYETANASSIERFLRANTDFHVTVARASGNYRLADTLASVLDEMERFFHFALASSDRDNEMRHEHHDLVEALLAGDGTRAERIASEQVRAAQRMVIDVMISGAQLETVNLAIVRRE
ncbi:MAG: GntR family transcriptional regulator [Candidatus Binataceae bacterium]